MQVYITSSKLKPLLLHIKGAEKLDHKRVLRSLQREILKKIRQRILQETFSPAARKALMQGMKVKLGKSSITVIATHPAFMPLLRGQRAGQMTWLVKARAPIPIITDNGKLIFRSATPKSMKNGSWFHPGRSPTTVIDKARKEAREIVKKRMVEELRKQLRKTTGQTTR